MQLFLLITLDVLQCLIVSFVLRILQWWRNYVRYLDLFWYIIKNQSLLTQKLMYWFFYIPLLQWYVWLKCCLHNNHFSSKMYEISLQKQIAYFEYLFIIYMYKSRSWRVLYWYKSINFDRLALFITFFSNTCCSLSL